MYRAISGTVFTLAAAAYIAAYPFDAAGRDQLAFFAKPPEASGSSDSAIDAAKAISRKPKPRVRYSVPPRKKN